MVNEEDAHRDVLVLMKAALQHVPTVNIWAKRQREGNSLELPQH